MVTYAVMQFLVRGKYAFIVTEQDQEEAWNAGNSASPIQPMPSEIKVSIHY